MLHAYINKVKTQKNIQNIYIYAKYSTKSLDKMALK